MFDIIQLLHDFYRVRNIPGFFDHNEKDSLFLTMEDNVIKLQSYEFKRNSCVLNQYNRDIIEYLLSLLTYKKNYSICVNLNYLEYHHVVIDLDFKKLDISVDFIERFLNDLIDVVKNITNNAMLIMVMFVKCSNTKIKMTREEILQSATHGVHFEIPECVLYRGDNIWFIETIRKLLFSSYPQHVCVIDSPNNWSLPYSKKKNKDMYLPVCEYFLNSDYVNTDIDASNVEHFVNRFSVVNYEKIVGYEFALNTDGVGYQFGIWNKKTVYKDFQISELNTVSKVSGIVFLDLHLMPHVKYAVSRFNRTNLSFVISHSPTSKSLEPFTIKYLREEICFHYDALKSGDLKAMSIFNLYVFLIDLQDKTFKANVTFKDETLNEIGNESLKDHYREISRKIEPLIEETSIQFRGAENPVRKINPILFIKCLFTQSFLESNKTELIFDDTTNESVFIPNKTLDLLTNGHINISELVKFMFPVYSSMKDSSVFYYEKNSWNSSTNKNEHLFLPTKIMNTFDSCDLPEDESINKKRKKNTETTNKLFQHLITFWGRIKTLPFPPNVISFADGFVQIATEYIVFHHTPLFRGQPSKLDWLNMTCKITHVVRDSCRYPDIVNLLIPKVVEHKKDEVVDFFRYSYAEEKGPKVDCSSVKKCDVECSDCPVYNTLQYLLTLFSGDLELTFFMLWTLRYCILGMSIKKALIYYGHGANGKTTFSNVLRFLFGNSLQCISTESIQGKISMMSPDLHAAKNAKMVYVDDIHKINGATLKQIVSGAFMYVRTLYQAGENIQMKFLLTGSCNSLKLEIDFALMQRVLCLPFLRCFSDNSDYYCNQETHKRVAEDMLATIMWIDRFSQETNVFYDNQTNITMPPKSVQWHSHQLIWKQDNTSSIINAFGIIEGVDYFIRPTDLIQEINRLRTTIKYPKYLSDTFDDVDALVNLLKHRYSVREVLDRVTKEYETVIVGITMDRLISKYNHCYLLI